ncbi:MAG: DNA repair protein RecN [Clostridia bacterium]|nr:DNA repair protein RecN [Clostridia bacterium]
MLVQLLIKNIALIDQLELTFGKGLHVLTGETGAGKSIVVDAVSLLLGGKANRELIRSGCEKAYSEGLFDLSDSPDALNWLASNDFETENDMLSISREISVNGRNVCRIQGVSVTLTQLQALTSLIMDLHGQHEHQSLLDEKNHMDLLDSIGDEAHCGLMQETAETFSVYKEAYTEYSRLKKQSSQLEQRIEELKKAESELSEANISEGEEDRLVQERDLYRSSEKIISSLQEACAELYDGSGETIAQKSRIAMRALAQTEAFGKEYAALSQRAQSLFYEAEDLGLSVRSMLDSFDVDPEHISQVEERLDLLRKLSRKYGGTTKEMIEYLEKVRDELKSLENYDVSLDIKYKRAQEAYKKYYAAASKLRESRKTLAASFEKQMENQLNALNMRGTRFIVHFEDQHQAPSASGIDSMYFLISPNAGEEPKSLTKIASGGELSRIMLAIKAISAEHDNIPSMVFDEIDTGISGRTAQVVAEKMWDIARYKQVICVTHLQQIAAMATRHYLVSKHEVGERTNTSVAELDGRERVLEIARMLSGVDANSESGLRHAEQMLIEAEGYRKTNQ